MFHNGRLNRRGFLASTAMTTVPLAMVGRRALADDALSPSSSIKDIREQTLKYIESMRLTDGPYGQYRYAADMTKPTLYSSTYAAMTRHLYRDLSSLSAAERKEWIEYLQSHQDDDGLFRDPLIFGEGWYKDDPEWCGRRHLSCHAVTALTCLGAVARKPMRFLEPFLQPGGLVRWLEARDWSRQPDFVGNEVLNVGTLIQYARDFQANKACAAAMSELFDWMRHHHMSERTGLWGDLNINDPREHSRAVQGAYHFWLLYFYDGAPIPYPDRAVDSCLKTQNKVGGFGQGVHNPDNPLNSSACEDIDSIDPLARLTCESPYRREDIHQALDRGLTQVLSNQMADGGYVFMRESGFSYGHPQLTSTASQGAMFPTWFRTLTLAYLGKALPDSTVGSFDWDLGDCPGLQFWGPCGQRRSK